MNKLNIHLNKLLALASRHKFIVERTMESTKGSHSVYEYGPLGTELRRNFRQLWWRDVMVYKERVHGIESSMFEPDNECTLTESEDSHKPATEHCVLGNLDKLVNEVMSYTLKDKCNDMTKTRDNLKELILKNTIQVKTRNNIYSEGLGMYKTLMAADSKISLPQGFAWNGMYVAMESDDTKFLRNIQEEMLCLQYYFEARTAKYWLNSWKRERLVWWRNFANIPSNFTPFEVQQSSQANQVTEIQYAFPWGKEQIETIEFWPNSNSFGNHIRMDSEGINGLHPNILQASASLNKGFLALLVDAFEEKERANSNGNVSCRSVLYLHPSLAPVKVAILSQNKEKNELSEVSLQLASELRQAGICTSSELDGRPPEEMYAYNDEIGTPYCITILESTLSNGVVALRNRDTTLQEFIHISDVLKTLQSHLKTV